MGEVMAPGLLSTSHPGPGMMKKVAHGLASSIWLFAMTFATDFEVQLNG